VETGLFAAVSVACKMTEESNKIVLFGWHGITCADQATVGQL
jgi:hypothetical protein